VSFSTSTSSSLETLSRELPWVIVSAIRRKRESQQEDHRESGGVKRKKSRIWERKRRSWKRGRWLEMANQREMKEEVHDLEGTVMAKDERGKQKTKEQLEEEEEETDAASDEEMERGDSAVEDRDNDENEENDADETKKMTYCFAFQTVRLFFVFFHIFIRFVSSLQNEPTECKEEVNRM
jgi:hypothetical protein